MAGAWSSALKPPGWLSIRSKSSIPPPSPMLESMDTQPSQLREQLGESIRERRF